LPSMHPTTTTRRELDGSPASTTRKGRPRTDQPSTASRSTNEAVVGSVAAASPDSAANSPAITSEPTNSGDRRAAIPSAIPSLSACRRCGHALIIAGSSVQLAHPAILKRVLRRVCEYVEPVEAAAGAECDAAERVGNQIASCKDA